MDGDYTVTDRNENWKSSWRVRRRFMFAVSPYTCGSSGTCCTRTWPPGRADTAITITEPFLTLINIVRSYVFGATWEDVSWRRLKGPAGATRHPPAPGASQRMEGLL